MPRGGKLWQRCKRAAAAAANTAGERRVWVARGEEVERRESAQRKRKDRISYLRYETAGGEGEDEGDGGDVPTARW